MISDHPSSDKQAHEWVRCNSRTANYCTRLCTFYPDGREFHTRSGIFAISVPPSPALQCATFFYFTKSKLSGVLGSWWISQREVCENHECRDDYIQM